MSINSHLFVVSYIYFKNFNICYIQGLKCLDTKQVEAAREKNEARVSVGQTKISNVLSISKD